MMLRNLVLSLTALCAVGLAVPQAQAGILIDPYLGYHTGKSKQSGQPDQDTAGLTYGARLGYKQLGFSGGLDYMTGAWKDSTGTKADITPGDLGVFFGFDFPIMIRAYGVYYFQSKPKVAPEGGAASYKLEGTGYKLGVGFTSLPFVTINLEYMMATYTKLDGTTLANNSEASMYGVSVSLPFDF